VPLLAEDAHRRHRAVDGAEQVGVDDALVHALGDLLERAEHVDAGVVDPDVDPVVGRDGRRREGVDLAGLGDVGGHDGHPRALAAQRELLERGGVAGGEDQLRPGLGERDGGGGPDAARGSGDDDDGVPDLAAHTPKSGKTRARA
jgi:hypothetical protein